MCSRGLARLAVGSPMRRRRGSSRACRYLSLADHSLKHVLLGREVRAGVLVPRRIRAQLLRASLVALGRHLASWEPVAEILMSAACSSSASPWDALGEAGDVGLLGAGQRLLDRGLGRVPHCSIRLTQLILNKYVLQRVKILRPFRADRLHDGLRHRRRRQTRRLRPQTPRARLDRPR